MTTGIEASFYYTRYFSRLDEVLAFGLGNFESYIDMARRREEEFAALELSEDRRWILAHAVHTYLGATELLSHKDGPLWVVNEGEYRMLNTFDLQVDHLFFELHWWPWAVRETLDLYAERYVYEDSIHSVDGRRAEGRRRLYARHGRRQPIQPFGWSSYELPNLKDCFSYMSSEQLVNWICCAVCYAETTGDYAWLKRKAGLLDRCMASLRRRDDPDPGKRNGIIKWDSDRCGPGGSEITTYDSLDVSLGQARNNLYLAVKTMAAWLLLSRAFAKLGSQEDSVRRSMTACLAGASVMAYREPERRSISRGVRGREQQPDHPGSRGARISTVPGYGLSLGPLIPVPVWLTPLEPIRASAQERGLSRPNEWGMEAQFHLGQYLVEQDLPVPVRGEPALSGTAGGVFGRARR